MDVNGAKALQQRLGPNTEFDAASATADVSGDAPPIYRWTGVAQSAPSAEAAPTTRRSWLRRLGLGSTGP